MAIRKISRMGHPVLRRKADLVEDVNAPEIRLLIRDMVETMVDAGGAGLAAPQVYEPLRLIVFHAPPDRRENSEPSNQDTETAPLTVLINPEFEPVGDERNTDWEGCLSIPDIRGRVPRYTRIKYKGLAPDGSPVEREASGFHARVVQHECDHLDGVLYLDRMSDMKDLVFESEWHHTLEDEDDA